MRIYQPETLDEDLQQVYNRKPFSPFNLLSFFLLNLQVRIMLISVQAAVEYLTTNAPKNRLRVQQVVSLPVLLYLKASYLVYNSVFMKSHFPSYLSGTRMILDSASRFSASYSFCDMLLLLTTLLLGTGNSGILCFVHAPRNEGGADRGLILSFYT
jgi:hypothetical protein